MLTKSLFALFTVFLINAAVSRTLFASSEQNTCSAAALAAAESYYGNDPDRTETRTVSPGSEYRVTVGIGNPEDGAHTYDVKFPGACDASAATVTEINL